MSWRQYPTAPLRDHASYRLVCSGSISVGLIYAYMIRSVTSDTQVTATSPAVNSFDEMIQSLPEIDEIDREDTRLYVERNFSAQVMAENYIRVYKKVMRNIP